MLRTQLFNKISRTERGSTHPPTDAQAAALIVHEDEKEGAYGCDGGASHCQCRIFAIVIHICVQSLLVDSEAVVVLLCYCYSFDFKKCRTNSQ